MATYDRDPTNEVVMRWHDDEDGIGKLFVAAAANGFSGMSPAWFNVEEVSSFAAAVTAYPLTDTAPPSLVSGFGTQFGRDLSAAIEADSRRRSSAARSWAELDRLWSGRVG